MANWSSLSSRVPLRYESAAAPAISLKKAHFELRRGILGYPKQ